MKRYAFIYNPAARAGKSKSKAAVLREHIESLPNAELFHSKSKGDIPGLIDQLLNEFDVFVACGGDGTIQEVASRLIDTGKIMGIIPLGSGNDLCKTLNIPTDLEKSLELVLSDHTIKMDVGRCNDFIFLNTLGFGFDGLTNRYACEMKNIHPFFRYAIAALKASVNQDEFRVQVSTESGKYEEAIMVSVANGRVEGGAFWIAPSASITDGELNLIIIRPIQKWLIPILLPFFLIKRPNWIPHVQSTKIDQLVLQFDNQVEIHADGEIIKNNKDKYSIKLIPKGLEVVCGISKTTQ